MCSIIVPILYEYFNPTMLEKSVGCNPEMLMKIKSEITLGIKNLFNKKSVYFDLMKYALSRMNPDVCLSLMVASITHLFTFALVSVL